ncbi:MAG: TlpA family protein disulfide reductase [Candidatus Sumerlaeia bacterium]|nr:TlpA family protein disulfide reductase [Candidatus Sumerlaeia bacterium]
MPRTLWRWCLVALVALALACAEDSRPVGSADAAAALEQARVRYANRLPVSVQFRAEFTDPNGAVHRAMAPVSGTLAWDRVSRLRLDESGDALTVNRQQGLLLVGDTRLAVRFEFEEPPNIEALHAHDPSLASMLDRYPYLALVDKPALLDSLRARPSSAAGAREFDLEGAPLPTRVTIEAASGRIVQTAILLLDTPPTWYRVTWSDEQLGVMLPDSRFGTAPPAGYNDVTEAYRGRQFTGNILELEGQPAPDFTVPLLDGGEIALADLRGKAVLLDFWASWCPLCIEGMPEIAAVARAADPEKAVVLGINLDIGNVEAALEVIAEKGVAFPQALPPDLTLPRDWRVGPLPMLAFVRPDGIIHRIHLGAIPSSDELTALLAEAHAAATDP